MTAPVGIADIIAARRVVDRYLPRAPLERSPLLSRELGVEIHLKIETFKPTRTFKVRGALNKIASLDAGARQRGVVAASAGSHALGVAYAAWALGVGATVVMPRGVSPSIVRVCEAYGAAVRLEGEVYDDTLALAHRIEADEGRTFVHPYADPLIVAGQGTVGLEILEDLPDVSTVVVGVGGGGLITGIGAAVKATHARVRIVGVEPEGADAFGRSLQAGQPVELERPYSIADKLVAKSTQPLNVELGQAVVDQVVTVSEEALADATFHYLERLSLLVEPSGAASLAALRSGRFRPAGGPVVLVISGGNAAPELLARIVSERSGALAATRVTVHHGRIAVRTRGHVDTVEITDQVVAEIRRSKISEGLCTISVLHTTAGIFVNENADPDVPRDLLTTLDRLVPEDATYRHAEGNSPGHIKSVITGSSVTLAVREGKLELGRWQGVYLAEFDGPRDRSATITCIGDTQG